MADSKIIDQLAILKVQEETLWTLCDKLDWPKILRDKYTKHNKKVKTFEKKHFATRVSITGYCDNDDIGHSDIDDVIFDKFADAVKIGEIQPDSEGGMFACDTTESHVKELSSFLKAEFPDLRFNSETDEDSVITPFINWHYSNEYAKKHNLNCPPLVDSSVLEKLEALDDKIKDLEIQKQELVENCKF